LALSAVPIWRVPTSAPVSQNMSVPTGYPRYIESKRSRAFEDDQTNGRWMSGRARRPTRMSSMRWINE